jgi:dihydrofolate reductase
MGKLTWSINVTLDGCCDHTHVIADAELHAYTSDVLDAADGLMLGRVSYELLESYWPRAARGEIAGLDENIVAFARRIDVKRKYVVSHTLDRVRWNASLIAGDLAAAVRKLKNECGDLLIFGSPGLGASLTQLGLVNEYHFLIQPIAAGRGPRLFDGAPDRNFRLLEVRTLSSGVILARHSTLADARD